MNTLTSRTLRICALLVASAILNAPVCFGQDVPKGVNYKKASPETNAKAKAELERALADNKVPPRFLSDVISCGPILWNDLKAYQESLSKDSTPITMFLSVPEPLQAEGRGFRTQEQRDRFWKLVLDQYPELRRGIVRPAKANEIQFYWATIPFDIEEPFFVVETPNNVFVVNLGMQKETPVLFWLDRMDDLRQLKH